MVILRLVGVGTLYHPRKKHQKSPPRRGYSAVRLARLLPSGGRLFSVENEPQRLQVAQEVQMGRCWRPAKLSGDQL